MRNQKPEEKKILSIFSDEENQKPKKSLTSLVWGEDFCPLSAQFHPSLHTRTHTRRLIGIHVVSLAQNSPPDQPIGFISPFFSFVLKLNIWHSSLLKVDNEGGRVKR
jgi:hypothetical protein